MPFLRGDAEFFDEDPSEDGEENLPPDFESKRQSGEFEYESAEARFTPAKLGRVARVMLDALLAAGATGLRVRYDGGYDEGFAHPDEVRFADHPRWATQVQQDIASPALLAAIRAAAGAGSMWGNGADVYAGASDDEALVYAMEELAHGLASRLLGKGFGTGEYQLYGAFTADFATGAIVDHADAAKPSDME